MTFVRPQSQPRKRLPGGSRAWLAALSAFALLIVTLGPWTARTPASAAPAHAKRGGTLTIAASSPPVSLNPILNTLDEPFQWYTELAYEPLIRTAPNGQLAPGLAKSWKYVGSGNRTFELTLRKGVRFSDGTPMTAAAVVKFLKVFKTTNPAPLEADIKSITAIGPLTVRITSTPDPVLPDIFSDNNDDAGYVISAKGLANQNGLKGSTDGAGPYVLDTAATIPNSTYVYNPNRFYYDQGAIRWSKIVVDVIADPEATLDALRSGQVQVAEGDPSTAAAAAAAGLKVTSAPASLYNLTVSDPGGKLTSALADPRVRQALDYAIDRPLVAKAIFGKYGSADEATEAPGAVGVTPSVEHYFGYNLKKAKSLLSKAGYAHGFKVTTLVTTAQADMTELAEAVAADWAKIGVTLSIVAPPPAVWPGYFVQPKWGLLTIGWPYYNLYAFVSGVFGKNGISNYFHYPFSTITSLLSEAATLPIHSARFAAVMDKIEANLIEQGYEIPVATQNLIMISSHNVAGIAIPGAYPVPDPIEWYPKG